MSSLHALRRGNRRYSLNEYGGDTNIIDLYKMYGSSLALWWRGYDLANYIQGQKIITWTGYAGSQYTSQFYWSQGTLANQGTFSTASFGGMPSMDCSTTEYDLNTNYGFSANKWVFMCLCKYYTLANQTIVAGPYYGNGQMGIGIANNGTTITAWAYPNSQASYTTSPIIAPRNNVTKLITFGMIDGAFKAYDGLFPFSMTYSESQPYIMRFNSLAESIGNTSTYFSGSIAEVVLLSANNNPSFNGITSLELQNIYYNYYKKVYIADQTFA